MENNFGYYSTFVFYLVDKRRLSIFGEDLGNGKMNITAIPCNVKDMFNKKEGRKIFESKTGKANIQTTIEIDAEHPQKSFMQYCKDNFYRIDVIDVLIPVEILIRYAPIPEEENVELESDNEDENEN